MVSHKQTKKTITIGDINMAKASLAKLKKLEGSRLASMGRARKKAQEIALRNQHTLFAVGSAAAVGFAVSRGVELPKVGDLEFTDIVGIGAIIAANALKGEQIKRTAQSIADGMLSVSAYRIASRIAPPKAVSGYGDEIYDVEDE